MITADELHRFVKENVLRQSADKQTPELQGDANAQDRFHSKDT